MYQWVNEVGEYPSLAPFPLVLLSVAYTGRADSETWIWTLGIGAGGGLFGFISSKATWPSK